MQLHTLAPNPLDRSKAVEIVKAKIEVHELSNTSPMPEGLLDTFTQDDILDLLAFIEFGASQ